jgi:hypothetical protein
VFACVVWRALIPRLEAGVAQLVEQLIRNQQVLGSSPSAGSKKTSIESAFIYILGPRRDLVGLLRVKAGLSTGVIFGSGGDPATGEIGDRSQTKDQTN